MIGLDTNVIVRYIMRDDPTQTSQADQLISSLTVKNPGYLSLVVLVELWWVLGRAYQRTTVDRLALFRELLRTDELRLENPATIQHALDTVDNGADFADSLIHSLATHMGCTATVTFDVSAASNSGMRLLPTYLDEPDVRQEEGSILCDKGTMTTS